MFVLFPGALFSNYAVSKTCPIENPLGKWDKLFKYGLSKICGRQPLQIWSDMVYSNRPYHFKYFEGYLQQILLNPCLNTLSQIFFKCYQDSNVTSYQDPTTGLAYILLVVAMYLVFINLTVIPIDFVPFFFCKSPRG